MYEECKQSSEWSIFSLQEDTTGHFEGPRSSLQPGLTAQQGDINS